ncbi:MAG: hypothetical protein KGH74_03565 [Candidatus Micrarchaeota archaeon]|nr:hypothetical protein [Candidatus Micrarchaeota archaeon]
MEAALLEVASNPLTLFKLLETIAFQVGVLGFGTTFASRTFIPWLYRLEGQAKYQKFTTKFYYLLTAYAFKGVAFILITGTLGILLTDVGWIPAIEKYGLPEALLFARASGAPNGAHLLSYIPLPLLGLYVAWKYRKDYLLDCYQGIFVIAFGVAVHEGLWLIEYWAEFAQFWNLAVASNVIEDFAFGFACVLLGVAFWKYPFRTIPLKVFKWPIISYSGILVIWFAQGLPITTINNYQIGQGIYMTTQWWGVPWVNGIEILTWVWVAASFFLVIWREPVQRQAAA